jgi:hypothetical protein
VLKAANRAASDHMLQLFSGTTSPPTGAAYSFCSFAKRCQTCAISISAVRASVFWMVRAVSKQSWARRR